MTLQRQYPVLVVCLLTVGGRAWAQDSSDSLAPPPSIKPISTMTVRMYRQDDMRILPIRGFMSIVGLSNGINQYADGWHVRGGRAGETRFFLDGFDITNPASMDIHLPLIQEALEEVRLEPGGFSVTRGAANSGIVSLTARTGGKRLTASLDIQTDDFAKPGNTFLGTSSFGYRNIVGTVGGPLVVPAVRFFLSGEHNYLRQRQILFLEPFRFDGLIDRGYYDKSLAGTPLPGPLEFKRNSVPRDWQEQNQASGTLLIDLNELASLPMKLKVTGGYSFMEQPEGNSWAYNYTAGALYNYYRSSYLMTERSTWMVSGKLTHDLSPSTRYEVGVAYQFSGGRTYDPNFGDDWKSYSDSLAWVAKGFSTKGWVDRYTGPLPWGPDWMSTYAKENSPNNQYSKAENEALDVTLDISTVVTEHFGLRAGGNISSWTQRIFSVTDISNFNKMPAFYAQYYKIANEYQIRLLNGRYLVSNYGYDYLGQKTDGYTLPGAPQGAVLDPPYKPVNGGAYLQLQYETGPAAFEFGARYEFFDERLKYVEPVVNPITNQLDHSNIWIDQRLDVIDESKIGDTRSFQIFLPRLGFSVVASENTTLYAHIGQYAQFPRLDLFYQSSLSFSGGLSPNSRSPYAGKFGFSVEPERTTSIEFGIMQRLSPRDILTISGYLKQMKNQVQLLHYYDSRGQAIFNAYTNADHGSATGLEFTLEHERWKRLAASISYTFADAAMTQWSPTSSGMWMSDVPPQYPEETYAPPFNFAHSAVINLDYRIEKGQGNWLVDGMGLNVLLRLNGGHAYTRIKPRDALGANSIWDVGISPLVDPRLYFPQELPGASTTPIVYNIDLRWSKLFDLGPINLELYVNVLNLLNTKQVINVYPMTGKPDDDGWLGSPNSLWVGNNTPNYRSMYNAFGNGNRYYAINTMIGDTYGPPRQIRVGFRLEY